MESKVLAAPRLLGILLKHSCKAHLLFSGGEIRSLVTKLEDSLSALDHASATNLEDLIRLRASGFRISPPLAAVANQALSRLL